MIKRIIGYLLIIFSVFLLLGILGSLGNLLTHIADLILALKGKEKPEDSGKALGTIFCWIFSFSLLYYAWKYGRKWSKKETTTLNLKLFK
ncbi:MAG: hypothetical protein KAX93_04155 [Flavobacterium sp.]|nr:hypothetical protein [Flavobacterium sp.]MBP8157550.1 hypothetical protein [Flavobacterium sp.]